MDRPGNSVAQKKRGRPRSSWRASLLSFRVDYDLEWELEDWRWLQPKPPSRSAAIRVLLRRALAAEKERKETSSSEADQKLPSSGA
jgi:hypothetical protein